MKKMILSILCAVLCACAAPAPSQEESSASQASEQIPEETPVSGTEEVFDPEAYLLSLPDDPEERDDIVIMSYRGIIHEELWDAFSVDTEMGNEASVTICQYTVEGDPIYTYVSYSDGLYTAVIDNSRDAFGVPEIYTVHKKYMYEQEYETQEEWSQGVMKTYLHRYCVLSDEELSEETDENGFLIITDECYYLWGLEIPAE